MNPMGDTHPEIEERFHQMMMARSGEERFLMGCSMFDAAKRLVRASILASHPEASEAEIRQQLFLRFYGHEFAPEERERILAWIRGVKHV